MTLLGELALWIAFPVAVWGMVLAFVAGKKGRGDLALSAERTVYTVFFLTILASVGVVSAFLNDRFEYLYVANYSSRNLETFYKVAGLWAGQTGSLLFWLLLLMLFSTLCVWLNRNRNREFMPYAVGVLQAIATFFLVVLLFADVNPFERHGFGAVVDGAGLNPQLQNYWMTIHPPTLYLGFTSFTIPFAFGVAALLKGRLDSRWIVVTRRWTLLSWFFLANGIVFGMRWAYEELGWGGYWFWDPVENASLLPFLSATAFLHSIQIQEKRGMLKVWNIGLVILTFVLTIFATFLTRSGLIESVHTFAENTKIAFIFLGFMGSLIALGVVLVAWRWPQLRSENQIESFLSRESAFLFNNLMLLGAAFAVLWGTLLPLLSEGFLGEKISVGPPFFNRVNIPIGLVLLALVGIGPVIAWRRASRRNLRRNFMPPLAVGLAVAGLFAAFGLISGLSSAPSDASLSVLANILFERAGDGALRFAGAKGVALLTFGISAFVLTVIVVEFWKGTQARARIEGEGHLVAFLHLVQRNRRRWGGYIVHVAIVLIFTAFAGAAWNEEVSQTLAPGESTEVRSPLGHTYRLTLETLNASRAANADNPNNRNLAWQAIALLSVEKNGRPIGQLTSEKRSYIRPEESLATEVGIRSTLLEDLYVILLDLEDLDGVVMARADASQRATIRVMVNPLVGWIWYGALVLTCGSLIAMWPDPARVRGEVAAGQARATSRVPAAAAAD